MVNQLLSEESKIKRNRKTAIGIQTTTITWVLEFAGGAIVLLSYCLIEDRDELTDFTILLLVVCLNFILIPASYLMIPSKCKQDILEKGWYKSLQMLIHKPIRIGPQWLVNLEMNDMSDANESNATTLRYPIRSIFRDLATIDEKSWLRLIKCSIESLYLQTQRIWRILEWLLNTNFMVEYFSFNLPLNKYFISNIKAKYGHLE